MRAWIVAIGDELLIGQVVNTNAAWLGERLTALGFAVERVVTVADDPSEIALVLGRALEASDLTIVTGGLGPTHDDVTRRAICELYGVGLRLDPEQLERVRLRFERRGLPMADSNRSQAEIPDSFTALSNPVGTAPGLIHEGDTDRGWGRLVVLPGIPHEMTTLMETHVLPLLAREEGRPVLVQKTLLTTGMGESSLQERIGSLDDVLGPDLRLAYLPSVHGVRLRITALGPTASVARAATEDLEALLRDRVGRVVYGEGDESLESVVGRLLRTAGLTVATAESCTGGLVSSRLTDISGSSDYVTGGIVAYDNAVKIGSLGVPAEMLAEHGAVSRPVAVAMAEGVRRALGADIGLATTGIMGPSGGTDEKPVGTVWIAVADETSTVPALLRLGHDRLRNKEQAATAVLNLLRVHLLDRDEGEVMPDGFQVT